MLFFGLLFLSELWVQPLQIGAPPRDIMWYSPSGAGHSLLGVPRDTPVSTLLTLVGYTLVFTVSAVRYFRWEWSDRSQRMTARAYLGATALLAVGVAVTACTSSSTDAPTTVTNPRAGRPVGSWAYPNGDAENTRDAAGSTISSANIASLQQAWTFKLPAAEVPSGPSFGSMAATPIVTNGVAFGIQPQMANGSVYLASSIGTGSSGVLLTLQASTGKVP